MRCNQILRSGLLIRQDFSQAVRAIFFQTEYEEFPYATDGGTLFIVNFRGRLYGLTCKHAFGTFDLEQIFITQDKLGLKGTRPAPIKGRIFPSTPIEDAAGTDVEDICAITFESEISPDFFRDCAYVIDEGTVGTSKLEHKLFISGALKSKSRIVPPDIAIDYRTLQFQDAGPSDFDPLLRKAFAKFHQPEFDNVTGISGAPVFDQTSNKLCGMVTRGGMKDNICIIHYIDVADIVRFLECLSEKAASAYYIKLVEKT